MRKSTITAHIPLSTRTHQARSVLRRGRERGSITLEYVLWALAIAALVAVAATALTAWITGKIGELG